MNTMQSACLDSFIFEEAGSAISIKVITNLAEFQKIENEYDYFVSKWSENPFLTSIFIKSGALLSKFRGWDPLLLIIYNSNNIVGIAPLAIRKRFGICFAQFLYGPNFLMDFVISEKHREVCVSKILHILTRYLKCKFVDLTFSEDSATLAHLQKSCEASHIYFSTKKSWFGGHRIIPVASTWNDFVKTKNKRFRQKVRRAERKIEALGEWRVTCVDRFEKDPQVCEKVLEIWAHSWKKKWLDCMGFAFDPELSVALNALRATEKSTSPFRWKVYFLELKSIPIAFNLVFAVNGTAYLKRGAYDSRYKKFFPGFFLDNYVIHNLFNEAKVHVIDWCADHHYQKFWAPICLSRNDVKIRSGLLGQALLTFPTGKYSEYPLTLLRALCTKHRSNPSLKETRKDQNELRLTACGKELPEMKGSNYIWKEVHRMHERLKFLGKSINYIWKGVHRMHERLSKKS
jgi:CelD/BcsL family acetyltransferase involved in cellulose biosynthesis